MYSRANDTNRDVCPSPTYLKHRAQTISKSYVEFHFLRIILSPILNRFIFIPANAPFHSTKRTTFHHRQRRRLSCLTMHSSSRRCLISCIYNAEIHSGGGGPTAPQSTVVNFVSNVEGVAPSALTPPQIQTALAPAKAAVLSTIGSFKCATCDEDAYNVCSSIAVYRGNNTNDNENVLHFFERMICSCNDVGCISEARRRRNFLGGRMGSFRCALEPISSVLSVTAEVGKCTASKSCIHEKENAHGNTKSENVAKRVKVTCE